MPDFILTTPVVFIVFNRPEVTARVFREIAQARPRELLVIADGARTNRPGESDLVARTRAVIDAVDWPCEVQTNYSNTNLGCKRRVSSGLDWAFSQVDRAIVLEDDCLPDPTFFRFCQEMLARFEDDPRIGIVSGDNFNTDPVRSEESYFFSRYTHIWGWASWRNRWQGHYDVHMARWPELRQTRWLADTLGDPKEIAFWAGIYEKTFNNEVDTWDYQWQFANWLGQRLNVMPSRNLISNIGFAKDATHTTRDSALAHLPTRPMPFPLTHAKKLERNQASDAVVYRKVFNPSLLQKSLERARRALPSYKRQ